MLQFIFGKAASGKTTTVHNMIKADSENGTENIILLVPEQFTFESEKSMLSLLGNGFMSKVEVQSFTRLSDTAGRLYGGVAGVRVKESERIMLMGSAVKRLAPQLRVFKKYINSSVFVAEATKLVSEFKMAGITAAELYKSIERITDNTLAEKLREITLIFAEYDSLLKGVYIDPLDEPEIFYKKALKNKFFKGKTVYIDAFKGFTGQQLKILKLIIHSAERVVISLTTDDEKDTLDGAGIFSNIKAAANTLIGFAKEGNTEILEPIKLTKSYFENEELTALEKYLSGEETAEFTKEAENITIASFETPKEELDCVFKTIHRMVRTKDYRYKDFVVIARDISKYQRRLELAAHKFDVPCYFDKGRSLISSPVAKFILFLLSAAKDFDSQSIFSMLKTGFFDILDEDIALLEEYAFTWDIKGQGWKMPWNMSSKGLVADFDGSKARADEKKLTKLNELRQKIVAPLIALNRAFAESTQDFTKKLYSTLITLGVDKRVKVSCDSFASAGDILNADFIMESWDEAMAGLDSVVRCFKNDMLRPGEYIELLSLAFSGVTIGSIPRMVDEVSCGSADTIRPARPKVTFVIGLCQGEFPAGINDGGLLLNSDRILMEKADINISDRFRKFATDENYLVYSSLCSAGQQVFALSHRYEAEGTAVEESSAIISLKEAFLKSVKLLDNNEFLPETPAEAFDYLFENYFESDVATETLKVILLENEDYNKRIEAFLKATADNKRRLLKETGERLYPGDLKLSATAIETYNKCAFSYFCKYVLGISAPEKAELNVLKRGTIAHFVLEKVLGELKENIADATKGEIEGLVMAAMTEYLNSVTGGDSINTPRFKYLYSQMGKMLCYVLNHISEEFKNCSFKPRGFEVNIGNDTGIDTLKIEFKKEQNALITGQIDRVDILEDGNFARIVDYKTGDKVFVLSDVLYGLNLQMLLYLFALKKNKTETFGEIKPAGILYMPVKRGMPDSNGKDTLSMNGMLISDKSVVTAMDETKSGRFVPKLAVKSRKANPNITPEDYDTVLDYVEYAVKRSANSITSGIFDVNPIDSGGKSACEYCDFSSVCGIEPEDERNKVADYNTDEVILKMREVLKGEGN